MVVPPPSSLGSTPRLKRLVFFWVARGACDTLAACRFTLFFFFPALQNLVLFSLLVCIPWYTFVAVIYSWLREMVQG